METYQEEKFSQIEFDNAKFKNIFTGIPNDKIFELALLAEDYSPKIAALLHEYYLELAQHEEPPEVLSEILIRGTRLSKSAWQAEILPTIEEEGPEDAEDACKNIKNIVNFLPNKMPEQLA